MTEGTQLLLDVVQGYRSAIIDGDSDQVLADLATRPWRSNPSVGHLPPGGRLSTVDDLFDILHLRVATGQPAEALVMIERVRVYLLAIESS